MHGGAFTQCGQACGLIRIITIRLTLNAGRLPRFIVSATDKFFEAMAHGKFIDPSRRSENFHDDVCNSLRQKSSTWY